MKIRRIHTQSIHFFTALLTMTFQLQGAVIDTKPKDLNDGIPVGSLHHSRVDAEPILALADDIEAGKYENIDSLLIAFQGKLVFESYYRESGSQIPHYQMSITKSVTSFVLGRVIQLGHLEMTDLDRPVVNFLQDVDRSKLAPGADTITVAQCLNMHSGIRIDPKTWNDMHREPSALRSQALAQAILSVTEPVTETSKQFHYHASDTTLVMQVIEAAVPGSVWTFLESEFLGKLGITDFEWPKDDSGLPQSNAGMRMRSRDMLKIGLLAEHQGRWQGNQLISAPFVEKATSPVHLFDDDGGGYGYFWVYDEYKINGTTYPTAACHGAGGQLVFVIPGAGLIVVVTSDTEGQQAFDIPLRGFVPKTILPAFLGKTVSWQTPTHD